LDTETVLEHAGASDVLFYVAGGAAAAAAGSLPLTRAARLPLLGLFGGSLVAERCLPPRLHSLLHAGDRGQVGASLQLGGDASACAVGMGRSVCG
jgi:hypothetical protein